MVEDIDDSRIRVGEMNAEVVVVQAVKIEEEKCFLQFAFPRNQSQRLGFRCR